MARDELEQRQIEDDANTTRFVWEEGDVEILPLETNDLEELIELYIETFGFGPPILQIPEDRRVGVLRKALDAGEPVSEDNVVMPDAEDEVI